ncbi:MAG: transposase domain-containing protein [Sphaerochaetaceae bacterium]|nr:transposase domain-containing protein [Spirochaetales bacterium]MDY5500643.1 transposase domain-containing protein [Sphaerochaetaceae bacterium]
MMNDDAWISVKALAAALGRTPRAVQIRLKEDGSIRTRRKDSRSIEIYVPSLPPDWQAAVVRDCGSVDSLMLSSLAPSAQMAVAGKDSSLASGAVSPAEKRRMLVAAQVAKRPHGTPKGAWLRAVAASHGISVSTVRRIADEIRDYGIHGKPREAVRWSGWDQQAIDWLQGFYLKAVRDAGACPKVAAWHRLKDVARANGWRIGGRTSAYEILKAIHPSLVLYAQGGRRALDNKYFWIMRDSTVLDPFQVVIGDQHIFDYWVADYESGLIHRPECYLWLDQRTKLVYGVAFAATHYSADTVKEAMRIGLYRWGRPDCTYNDNGSSECGKASSQMIDDLLRWGVEEKDVSDLYRLDDGRYADEHEDGSVSVVSQAAWRQKHRRIFANVRNAKTKDIERFFNTVESKLDGMLLPGRCATPGADIAVDEVERKRLERQKERRELLTAGEFARMFVSVLDEYEHTRHASLGMSPAECLEKLAAEGRYDRKAREIPALDIELITADRKRCKVQRGRVVVDGIWYKGPELSATDGAINDTGLERYDGQLVEIRYSRHDRSFCHAAVSGGWRRLEAVTPVPMLDQDAMVEALKEKNRQIAAVADVFKAVTRPIIGKVTYQPPEEGQELRDVTPHKDGRPAVRQERRKAVPFLPLHASERQRYEWCLRMLADGHALSGKDKAFCRQYRKSDEYQEYLSFWNMKESMVTNLKEELG